MKNIKWMLLLGFFSTSIMAQNTADSTQTEEEVNPWTKSWVFSLTGNQAEYNNWSRGGVNSTAFTASTLFVRNIPEVITRILRVWTFVLVKSIRKVRAWRRQKTWFELVIKLITSFPQPFGVPLLRIAFRTQFTEGFDEETGEIISDFMSPGYITESLGLSYQPVDYFSTQLGLDLNKRSYKPMASINSMAWAKMRISDLKAVLPLRWIIKKRFSKTSLTKPSSQPLRICSFPLPVPMWLWLISSPVKLIISWHPHSKCPLSMMMILVISCKLCVLFHWGFKSRFYESGFSYK